MISSGAGIVGQSEVFACINNFPFSVWMYLQQHHAPYQHQAQSEPYRNDVSTLKVEVDKLSSALSDVMGAVHVLVDEKRRAPPPPPPLPRPWEGSQLSDAPNPHRPQLHITQPLPAEQGGSSMYHYASATHQAYPDQAQADACDAIQTAIRALRSSHAPDQSRARSGSPRINRSYVSPLPPQSPPITKNMPMEVRWAQGGADSLQSQHGYVPAAKAGYAPKSTRVRTPNGSW